MNPSDRLIRLAATLRANHYHMTALDLDAIAAEVRKLERFHAEVCAESDADMTGMDEAARALAAGVTSGRVIRLRGRV